MLKTISRRRDARLSFTSIRLFSPIKCVTHSISPLCAPRAFASAFAPNSPTALPCARTGFGRGVYHVVGVIGMARTGVMILCGTVLWPAAQRSGPGPLVVGIQGRMLASDSRTALTIVSIPPHKDPFVQVGPDGELRAMDDPFFASTREVRISYALFCATFDIPCAIIACHVHVARPNS